MRFRVFPAERITEELVGQAYLVGHRPDFLALRSSVEGGRTDPPAIGIRFGNLHVPWPVKGMDR